MCLKHQVEVENVSKINCFKLFHRGLNGQLYPPFTLSYNIAARRNLVYVPNKRIKVQPSTAMFYAFDKEEDAHKLRTDRRTQWDFICSKRLVVLPVTIYPTIFEGYFSFSNRYYCEYLKAYMAQEILVHV